MYDTDFHGLRQALEKSVRRIEHVQAAQQHEGTAEFLQKVCTFGFLVSVQILLTDKRFSGARRY
jgi:hypothetical protein